MKTGIMMDTTGYGRYGDKKYQKLRELGYSCADFSLSDTTKGVYHMTEQEAGSFLAKERKLAEEAGVTISQVHGPWVVPKPELTEEGRIKKFEDCKKSIRFTAMLGSKNWVIHPLMPYDNDLGTEFVDKTYEFNLDFFGRLLKTAEEEDVTICIENLPFPGFSISKADAVCRLVKDLNSKHAGMCIDTGHVACFNEVSPGDVVRNFGTNIKVFHIHDTIPGHDLHMMPGFGIIDWQDFAMALKETKFDGVFSLETLPPRKLPNEIFEEMSVSLSKIVKYITADL